MKRNIRSGILIATAFFATNAPALAQTEYPAKPIRMVVPFPPGGTSDTLARILGQKITDLSAHSQEEWYAKRYE